MATRRLSARQLLAANVRRERLQRGWSQEELAARAGISQTYTSQMESCRRAVSIDVVEKLAGALGVELPNLLAR